MGRNLQEEYPVSHDQEVEAVFRDSVGTVEVTGGMFAMEYELKRGSRKIGSVKKKYFALLDRYALELNDGEDKLAMAAILVCLDQIFKDDH